ncbi:hypothetical protein BRC83_01600 [Halobacteriales archaeon QS_1_68_17]|nr:MAG: hypothetical protein BRC83_01600 [Halobacteriales archaeon QS_1_68_17]
MDLSGDDLAGVVDLFGALTRAELREAVGELAFKRGDEVDPEAVDAAVEEAVAAYRLVSVDPAAIENGGATGDLLAVGPAAFPSLPEGGADLPHIMDVPDRSVDREALASAVAGRFRDEAADALAAGDEGRIAALADVSYDIEAWASVDVAETRAELTGRAGDE